MAGAVLAVLLGAVLPLADSIAKFRLEYESKLLAQRLKYVREISRRADYYGPVSGREYALAPRMYLDNSQHQYMCRMGSRFIKRWDYDGTVNIKCNRAEIAFSQNGEATVGTYTVSVGNNRRRVVIDRVGRIRIE